MGALCDGVKVGAFYANVMVFGATVDEVASHVEPPALVANDGPVVLLFAKGDEDGAPTAERLTQVLNCTSLTVNVHDSDLLSFEVHQRGELIQAGIVPDPAAYFEGADPADYEMPDAADLGEALGRGMVAEVAAALQGEFLYAEDRHEALLRALGLPTASVSLGYQYVDREPTLYTGPSLRRVE